MQNFNFLLFCAYLQIVSLPILLCSFVVNETLDSILDESGDEEEQEAVVNQVLDEIGIEISGKVRRGPLF